MQEHIFQTGLNRSKISQRETLLLEFEHNGRYQISRRSEDADHIAAVVDTVNRGKCTQARHIQARLRLKTQTILVADLRQKGRWRIKRNQFAAVDDSDAIAEPFGFVHKMCHQQHGCAVLTNLRHQVPGLTPGLRVESRRQFIKKDHLGLIDQRKCNEQPLFLTAGARLEVTPTLVPQSPRVE